MVLRLWAIVAMVALFGHFGTARAEPRLALVIGNSHYTDKLGPLANPESDARSMAEALRRAGFEVDLETNADRRTMQRAISRLGQRLTAAGAKATGLFFYAGHGLQSEGVNYLAPIDAAIESTADLAIEAVPADAVLEQMRQSADTTNIIILDACRDTPILRATRSAARGLARLDAPTGSYVAYSTAPGETAQDGNGSHSPYVAALLREIGKPGLEIESLFRNVRRAVVQATGGRQTPWDSSSLMNAFYFRAGGNVASPDPTAGPAETSALEQPCALCIATHPVRMVGRQVLGFGVTEVTRGQWKACVLAGACRALTEEGGDNLPVTQINWTEAMGFASWLSVSTGRPYRLPTVAEWKEAAAPDLAGTSPPTALVLHAVGRSGVGPSSLSDMLGNVAEWTADCGQTDAGGACNYRIAVGRSWHDAATVTPLVTNVYSIAGKGDGLGFRLVQDSQGE